MSDERKKPKPKSRRFIYFLLRKAAFIYSRLFLGYRCKDKYKIKKGESVVVLCNHQTDADPFCVLTSFNRPVFPVATDNIFAGKFRAKFFSSLGVIAKKKGISDIRAAAKMREVIKNNGSLLFFPEGNRSFCEFQFYISPSTAKLLKTFKATVVLFNLYGGTGISPRFKNKNRKGKFTGKIKRVLKYEDYALMSDEALNELIKAELRVFDSESGLLYKSKRRAEFLERMFFVCPVCGKKETLFSKGNYLFCRSCGTKTEYTEDLHLKSENPAFPFTKVIDYWNFQKRYILNLNIIHGEDIFTDKNVKVVSADPYRKRQVLYKGDIRLDDCFLYFGNNKFDIRGIEMVSVISGRTVTFLLNGNNYVLRGDKRFNPLKYAFIFNRLETEMKKTGADLFFNLKEN